MHAIPTIKSTANRIELLQIAAERFDAPKFERAIRFLASKNNVRSVLSKDWIDILAGIVVCQLAQKLSVLAVEIKMRMTRSFGLQISNRDDDFGRGAEFDRER